jgi:proteasome accessory factor C
MARIDNTQRLHRLLNTRNHPAIALQRICDELECSEKTARRTIEDLRDRLGQPIVYAREQRGWCYDGNVEQEIPGFFFNESELMALLTMRRLLEQTQPGLLEDELAPIGERVETILENMGLGLAEAMSRVRIVAVAGRSLDDRVFRCCSDAVLTRRRLAFNYAARGRSGESEPREVSPQRLTHYRDNWYLDAWCHTRKGLRIFSVDQIREPHVREEPALDVEEAALDAEFTSGYGIFPGAWTDVAVLRFTPHRASWVSKEVWHPEQESQTLEDGSWELRLPYRHSAELVMDVLKYGPDVEVVGPPELRELVRDRLAAGVRVYGQEPAAPKSAGS